MAIAINKTNTSTVTFAQPQEVVINAADDSIAIADKTATNFLAINSDGSINVAGSSIVSGTVSTNQNGLAAFQTSQYSVGTSAVQLTVTPLANRKSVAIKAKTTTNYEVVYIGTTSGVTTSTGYPLFNGDSIQLDLTGATTIYAIGSSAGQLVYTLELGS